MSYKPTLYKSPLDLKERMIGRARIVHRLYKPGDSLPVVGVRQGLLRGQRPCSVKLDKPLRVHVLDHLDHGCWMTDMPEELNQIGEMLYDVEPVGRVLVGGLGLGILTRTLAARVGIDAVTVVEKDADVIKLCRVSDPKVRIVHRDIMAFLAKTKERFDCYLLDTWQGTNEGTWWSQVMPQRRIIRNRWGLGPTVHCWAEDIMLGQIVTRLTSTQPHWYYTGLPVPMTKADALWFVRRVGDEEWEDRYGKAVTKNSRKEKEE